MTRFASSSRGNRILIADDDPVTRMLLSTLLGKSGYEVLEVGDGNEALRICLEPDAPALVILDWSMPGLTGPEICREIRRSQPDRPFYFLLLTARTERKDRLEALGAGADDFLSKPCDREELQIRLLAGKRVVELQRRLEERAEELQRALDQVKTLHGLLPICAGCKRIRDDQGYWQQVESYVSDRLDVQFTHGLCPACVGRMRRELSDLKGRTPRP